MNSASVGSSVAPAPDAVVAQGDFARARLVDDAGAAAVGELIGVVAEDARVASYAFTCELPGYPGWHWMVTVALTEGAAGPTLDEIVLLPGEQAILAPAWVPWRERIKPGDLSPGDLLPVEEDDDRLVPGYFAGDEEIDRQLARIVADEVGLGRARVLSADGSARAADRWYTGDAGPDAPIAQSAPGRCLACGFLVRLAGPLSTRFGVCANEHANDDGRVVAFNHGCGAHSEAQLRKKQLPPPLPDPVFDTLTPDDLETF